MNLKIVSITALTVLAGVAMIFGFATPKSGEPLSKSVSHKPVPTLKSPVKKHVKSIPNFLQDISVTIHAGNSQGSGVLKTCNGVNYVLTAGHVIAGLRRTRKIIDSATGAIRIRTEFDDPKIVKEVYDDDGRSVGRLQMDAEVIRYSDSDYGEDVALLRLLKKRFVTVSTEFYTGKDRISIGTELYHCGSLLGQQGSNSVTPGMISQQGRVIRRNVYDQSTCAAFPGSSGGGVYMRSDGRYVGMLVRGTGESFNLYVPIRRIRAWAERVGVGFLFDSSLPVPRDVDLNSYPIEEFGGTTLSQVENAEVEAVNRKFPFLIKRGGGGKPTRKFTFEW